MNTNTTQQITWYIDRFPWRDADEYMWRRPTTRSSSTETGTARATGVAAAEATTTVTVTAVASYVDVWSHRPLVDGVNP